jgi:hypothetical protein
MTSIIIAAQDALSAADTMNRLAEDTWDRFHRGELTAEDALAHLVNQMRPDLYMPDAVDTRVTIRTEANYYSPTRQRANARSAAAMSRRRAKISSFVPIPEFVRAEPPTVESEDARISREGDEEADRTSVARLVPKPVRTGKEIREEMIAKLNGANK